MPGANFQPEVAKAAHLVAGPIAAVAAIGETTGDVTLKWIGDGYLDHLLRVERVEVQRSTGPVFAESLITYYFEQDRQYQVSARLFAHRPYINLVEDFNLGAPGKFIFNYGDWDAARFMRTKDGGFESARELASARNAAHDFIRLDGQDCLARLVVWNQFGYFAGKQDNIGLIDSRDELAIGGFLVRPDRWTRAKLNHVDLYRRPQVDGDRLTRGVVGLEGAVQRLAMEAWLIDGHREWGFYVTAPRNRVAEQASLEKTRSRNARKIERDRQRGKKSEAEIVAAEQKMARISPSAPASLYIHPHRLLTFHTRDGIWPLDRLNRLTLVMESGWPTSQTERRSWRRA